MNPGDIGKPHDPIQMDPDSPYLRTFNQAENSELSHRYQRGLLGNGTLRDKLIALAKARPELRAGLVPLLRRTAEEAKAR